MPRALSDAIPDQAEGLNAWSESRIPQAFTYLANSIWGLIGAVGPATGDLNSQPPTLQAQNTTVVLVAG